MKLTTTLILLLTLTFVNGQITLTKSNFPDNGDEYNYSLAPINNGLDVSNTGANSIWDYSQLNSINYDSLVYASVGSTPLAYQINFNIPFSSYRADYAIVGNEINAFNQVTITDVFDFHKRNNSSIEMVGFGANVNGIPASIRYDTIDQLYPLPLSFGTEDSTTAYYLLDIPTLGAYGQQIQRKVEADGWGELTTPYQNYPNCLRVKTTLYQRDTLKVEQPFSLPGVAFNRPVETTYEWFTTGIGAPVFSITQQGSVTSRAKYIDENTSSIFNHQNDFDFTVFPNPTMKYINLETPIKEGKVIITTMRGKVVLNEVLNTQLDVSSFNKGNYILSIIDTKGNGASKIIQIQ